MAVPISAFPSFAYFRYPKACLTISSFSPLQPHNSFSNGKPCIRPHTLHKISHHVARNWANKALPEAQTPPEAPIQEPQQLIQADSTSGSPVVGILIGVAFIALLVLTLGVIYIAVTDFLQKREREKFEKEEAEKIKKGGKKKRVRVKTGPKGFGQKKIQDNFDDDDD